MKKYYKLIVLFAFAAFLIGCSSDDNSPAAPDTITAQNFFGKWEHYADKKVTETESGRVLIGANVEQEDLNDPCYSYYMEFTSKELIYSGTDYDYDADKYLCELTYNYITEWWYDEGNSYFVDVEEVDGVMNEIHNDFHFTDNGDLILMITGTDTKPFFRKIK